MRRAVCCPLRNAMMILVSTVLLVHAERASTAPLAAVSALAARPNNMELPVWLGICVTADLAV
eukprot:1462044-Amphidinium_carterae.1